MSAERVLEGRVALVTGSSRGIGRAMSLRLAREGAAVVITGKSESGTDKLPGSIHTVAAEVEAAGGSALAVRVDVRHEDEVKAMVDATIDRFGRLDILINNAGALWWQPILQTPPKRYDLMWEINVRAAYLCAYYALPHMVANHWGHVINCSPPISTQPSPGHVAYMTTKMGMTRLAIGIAAEHADDGIASNSLWPVTIIESLRQHQLGPRRQEPVAVAGDPLRRDDGDRRDRAADRSPVSRSSTSHSCANAAGRTSVSTPTGWMASLRSIRCTSTGGPDPRCRFRPGGDPPV